MRTRYLALFSFTLLCAACTDDAPSTQTDAGAVTDLGTVTDLGAAEDAGDDAAAVSDAGTTAEEAMTFRRAGEGANALTQALIAVDALFEFDPTLNASHTNAMNAMAIESHVGTSAACATVTRNDAMVTVDFGSSPGCTVASGAVITGSVDVALTGGEGTIEAIVAFTGVIVNDTALDGTIVFTSTDATTFTLNGSISGGTVGSVGHSLTFSDLTVTGSPGAMSITGSMTVTRDEFDATLTFSSVIYSLGTCYPSGGTLVIERGPATQTITFGASTPSTGVVTMQQGPRTTMPTLPEYGTCPHA